MGSAGSCARYSSRPGFVRVFRRFGWTSESCHRLRRWLAFGFWPDEGPEGVLMFSFQLTRRGRIIDSALFHASPQTNVLYTTYILWQVIHRRDLSRGRHRQCRGVSQGAQEAREERIRGSLERGFVTLPASDLLVTAACEQLLWCLPCPNV